MYWELSEGWRHVQASQHFAASHFKHTLQIWPQAHMDQPSLALHLTKTITVSLQARPALDMFVWGHSRHVMPVCAAFLATKPSVASEL